MLLHSRKRKRKKACRRLQEPPSPAVAAHLYEGSPWKNKKRDLLPCGQSSLAPPHPHPATPHPLILNRIHYYVSNAVVTMYKFLSASGQEIFSPWLSITLICFPFLYQESLYSVCTSYSEGDHEGVSVGTGCSNFESLLLRHIWATITITITITVWSVNVMIIIIIIIIIISHS